MWPTIFSLGPVALSSASLFSIIGFLAMAFVLWRRGREEHYREDQLFDQFLTSSIFGLLIARVTFIVLNFHLFGLNPNTWLDLGGSPGFSLGMGVIAAGLHLARSSRKNKWDVFEILDLWVIGLTLGLGIFHLGSFLSGAGVGYVTGLPLGLIFPGQVEPHHPTQLYTAGFYLSFTGYLWWLEYNYRTFSWYRRGKRAAQTGFLISTFMITSGAFLSVRSFLQPATLVFWGVELDLILYLALTVSGLVLMLSRSGRLSLRWPKK